MGNWLLQLFVDETSIPSGLYGYAIVQLIYLFCLYACLYTLGCVYLNKANDKLLVFPKNEALVGSVIIPFLSSFPDVLVIFASAFLSRGEVENYLGIGVGAMAGNINLGMTIPFILGIWFASIPLTKSGDPDYKRKQEKTTIFNSGCSYSTIVSRNNILIIVSSIPSILLILCSFIMKSYGSNDNHPYFRIVIFIAFILSTIIFISYLLIEYFYFGRSEFTVNRREYLFMDNIDSGLLTLYDVFYQLLYNQKNQRSAVDYNLFMNVVKRFFRRYAFIPADFDNDHDINSIMQEEPLTTVSDQRTIFPIHSQGNSKRIESCVNSLFLDENPQKGDMTPVKGSRNTSVTYVVDLYSIKCIFKDIGCTLNVSDLYKITDKSLFDFDSFFDLLIDCYTMVVVDDLNLDIEEKFDHLTCNQQLSHDGVMIDDMSQTHDCLSFADSSISDMHSSRFYSLKHRLMSVGGVSDMAIDLHDNHGNDEIDSVRDNVMMNRDVGVYVSDCNDSHISLPNVFDEEYQKRGDICADSASASIVDEIRDYAPDIQKKVIWQNSIYYLIIGGIHANIWCYPLCNSLGEISLRLGISPFFAGYVFSALIAYASDYFDIPRWAKRRSVRSMTCILCYLQGCIIVMNSLDIACICGIMYFRRIKWQFSSAILSMICTEIVFVSITSQSVIKKWSVFIVGVTVVMMLIVNFLLPKLGIL